MGCEWQVNVQLHRILCSFFYEKTLVCACPQLFFTCDFSVFLVSYALDFFFAPFRLSWKEKRMLVAEWTLSSLLCSSTVSVLPLQFVLNSNAPWKVVLYEKYVWVMTSSNFYLIIFYLKRVEVLKKFSCFEVIKTFFSDSLSLPVPAIKM